MRVLTINGGSSSVKFALFDVQDEEIKRIFSGKLDHIGLSSSYVVIDDQGTVTRNEVELSSMEVAREVLFDTLAEYGALDRVDTVAHRVVHGGRFEHHVVIDESVLGELRRMIPYDPDHMPDEIALIESFGTYLANVPHVACFDTVFHRTMPSHAKTLPIPRRYREKGIERVGFHGLSYQYLMDTLRREARAAAEGRVVLAHLGSGASLAAVSRGVSVDTTMAFSPNSGILMGTRSGDIDPGVMTYLSREEKLPYEEIDQILSKESGLLGISDTTYDMYALITHASEDAHAEEAVDAFCYAVKKQIGAYAAALGGIDTLVFSGGIGEQSAPIRARILDGLSFLGVRLDAERNERGDSIITTDDSSVVVRVIATDEECVMVTIARDIIGSPSHT